MGSVSTSNALEGLKEIIERNIVRLTVKPIKRNYLNIRRLGMKTIKSNDLNIRRLTVKLIESKRRLTISNVEVLQKARYIIELRIITKHTLQ